jgi:hypothetical protein
MRLKIRGLRHPGVLPEERLVLEAVQHGDIGSYAVFCTRLLSTGDVSSKVERTFWFPDKKVQAGDLVVLYTKKGAEHDRQNEDKTTTHFFYWNLDAPLWNGEVVPVVANLRDWEAVSESSA